RCGLSLPVLSPPGRASIRQYESGCHAHEHKYSQDHKNQLHRQRLSKSCGRDELFRSSGRLVELCPPLWKTAYESFASKPQLLMKLIWIRSFVNYGQLLRSTSTMLVSGRLR